jgi:hypothetical protein
MDFNDIGPLQLLVIGFGPEAEFEGLVLDELERLTARGLIRVIDLQFVFKNDDGALIAIELSGLDDEEAADFGAVISRLIGIETATAGEPSQAAGGAERSFGLGPEELTALADDLQPGASVGLLLFEHTWASELKAAIRTTGGFPIAQGFLTPEALMMVGEEVRAIAEAEATIELADAISGAAMLDAMATVAVAEDIKTAAAIEAVQALIVAGLIADAAATDALEALLAAELIEMAAVEAAGKVVDEAERETNKALAALSQLDDA